MSEYGTARGVLGAVGAALAAANRPIATQYVQVGAGALDRELLCVRLMRGYRGVPAVPRVTTNNCNDPGAITLVVCVLRDCWPVSSNSGAPPDPADIDLASQDLALDADITMSTLLRYTSLPDGGPPYPAVGTLDWLTPSGGLAGFTLTVDVAEAFT